MDNLSNYINLSNAIESAKDKGMEEEKEKYDDKVKGIRDITNPFGEAIAQNSITDLSKFATSKLAGIIRKPIKDANDLQEAYRKKGLQGIVNKSRQIHQKVLGVEPDEGVPTFEGTEGITSVGEPSTGTSIAGMSREEFSGSRRMLRIGLDDEVSKLSPNQQSAFSHLLGQNTKNELEIPDDLDRTQHNLQVGKDTLENVKKNVPESLPDPEEDLNNGIRLATRDRGLNTLRDSLDAQEQFKQSPQGSRVEETSMDDASEAYQKFTGDQSQGQASKVTELSAQAEKDTDLINQTSKLEAEEAEKEARKHIIRKAEKEGAEKAGEEDVEAGGPEDVGGDIVSFAVGAGVFVGGLFGARHVHQSAISTVSNFQAQGGI